LHLFGQQHKEMQVNIIENLTARIEAYRVENKNPCKNYATQAAAEKATAKMAIQAAAYFTKQGLPVQSARYVVFFIPAWGRWVGCIDLTELLARNTSTGGYLGFCKDFFTY
jgi:hypothetical protein